MGVGIEEINFSEMSLKSNNVSSMVEKKVRKETWE